MIEALILGVGLSVGWTVPEDLEPDVAYQVDVGDRFYAFGSYTRPSFRRFGQTLRGLQTLGYGVGVTVPFEWGEAFAQIGYYDPEHDADENVLHEVVRTQLTYQRGPAPFAPDSYIYEIKPDYGITVGARFNLTERVQVFGSYRALKLKETVEMWDEDIGRHIIGEEPDCNCWWREDNRIDAGAFELGIRFEIR